MTATSMQRFLARIAVLILQTINYFYHCSNCSNYTAVNLEHIFLLRSKLVLEYFFKHNNQGKHHATYFNFSSPFFSFFQTLDLPEVVPARPSAESICTTLPPSTGAWDWRRSFWNTRSCRRRPRPRAPLRN